MSQQENKRAEDVITQAIGVLSDTFVPAKNTSECAKRYTSVQLSSAIYELTGVVVDTETLYEIMIECGYHYEVDETSASLKYVWLLKYRSRQ